MNRRQAIKRAELALALEAGRKWHDRAEVMDARKEQLRDQGPKGLETATRVGKFLAREMLRSRSDPSMLGFERRFGPTLDYEYVGPVESQAASKSVARLVEVAPNGSAMTGFATGFMVCPRLLLTNWHVFENASWAEGVCAQFGYEYLGVTIQRGVTFKLLPSEYFLSNRDLDFALVAVDATGVDGGLLSAFSYSRLIPAEGKILRGHGVNMIGYPEGMPKTYVFRNNPLIDLDETCLRYLTDSDEGASGSPAYNPVWELIALHHRAIPRVDDRGRALLKGGGVWTEGMSTEDIEWVANEGIRVSVIVDALRKEHDARPHPLLSELLQTAVDPVGNETMENKEGTIVPIQLPNSTVQMTFSGPVTINVGTAAGSSPQLPTALAAPSTSAATPAVGAEAIIRFDPDYQGRPGYDPKFLGGFTIRHPKAAPARQGEMLKDGDSELVLDYHHYSLAMNKKRRLQMWSAVNANYTEAKRKWFNDRKAFGTDKWIPDPRIPPEYQIMDSEAYEPSKSLQRGHIVRRDDSAWGTSKKNQEYSNSDTFHWTNCTPQHGGFNQSSHFPGDGTRYEGIWGGLENKVAQIAKKADKSCITVFAGPVLSKNDPIYTWGFGDVQIPMKYWKIVVTVESGKLCAYGLVLDQTQAFKDLGFERMSLGKFKEYETAIKDIAKMTGLVFDPQVVRADQKGK